MALEERVDIRVDLVSLESFLALCEEEDLVKYRRVDSPSLEASFVSSERSLRWFLFCVVVAASFERGRFDVPLVELTDF